MQPCLTPLHLIVVLSRHGKKKHMFGQCVHRLNKGFSCLYGLIINKQKNIKKKDTLLNIIKNHTLLKVNLLNSCCDYIFVHLFYGQIVVK